MDRPPELVLSCEHASARVPPECARLFAGAEAVLQTHEGHDIGALAVARALGRRFGVRVSAAAVSRLVVDANRSAANPAVFSRFVRSLPDARRQELLVRYHAPHRDEVGARCAAAIRRGSPVVHVSVHSFTPQLGDRVRNCDIGILYDPQRQRERGLCRRWQVALAELAPQLRVRRNHPYRGTSDGLTRSLRRHFAATMYAGVELEVNQDLALRSDPAWLVPLADALAVAVGRLAARGDAR